MPLLLANCTSGGGVAPAGGAGGGERRRRRRRAARARARRARSPPPPPRAWSSARGARRGFLLAQLAPCAAADGADAAARPPQRDTRALSTPPPRIRRSARRRRLSPAAGGGLLAVGGAAPAVAPPSKPCEVWCSAHPGSTWAERCGWADTCAGCAVRRARRAGARRARWARRRPRRRRAGAEALPCATGCRAAEAAGEAADPPRVAAAAALGVVGQSCDSDFAADGDKTYEDCEEWCDQSKIGHCRFCKCRGCKHCRRPLAPRLGDRRGERELAPALPLRLARRGLRGAPLVWARCRRDVTTHQRWAAEAAAAPARRSPSATTPRARRRAPLVAVPARPTSWRGPPRTASSALVFSTN